MENNWEPRVGQKVVALITVGRFVKDNPYTVAHTYQCKCGTFHVEVEEIATRFGASKNFCMDCQTPIDRITYQASMRSIRFAPIISDKYPNQTSEIAQSFKEHPDTVDGPVKVLETVN